MSDPLAALSRILDSRAWLVGGALRDRLLGRPTADFDIALEGPAATAGRALARAEGGHAFELSEGFGAWRVVARDHSWQIDLLPLGGHTIEADLAQRDVTINAIAEPLGGGDYVDPFDGLGDLRQRCLRMVSESAFEADPLRTLRVARLACELDFTVELSTASSARRSAPGLERVAPERIFAELKRVVIAERALQGLAVMDSLDLTQVVLPELTRMRGVEQSPYHHLDVHDHTRAVLGETIELERDPGRWFGDQAPAIHSLLSEPLANSLSRGQALRFGALLHDVAKPQTRNVTPEGRITFIGHDESGAQVVRAMLGRMRASERLTEYVATLARHHLRLGFLVPHMPLTRRDVYAYMQACEPVHADVTLLSVADRLATRGRGSERAIELHLELARQLLGEALAWREHPPAPPLRGDELARALGLEPGPRLGRLLRELEEAAFAGEITTRDQAIERARELLTGSPAADR